MLSGTRRSVNRTRAPIAHHRITRLSGVTSPPQRARLRSVRVRSSISTLLTAFLLSVFALPRADVIATTVGPLVELTAGPTSASQRHPVAAWDGTRYVVVWEDGRSTGSGSELYLTRVMADGTIVDTDGAPVLSPPQPGNQSTPSIAYFPTSQLFMLTWVDPRDGGAEIYAARYSPNMVGTVLEPGGIQLTAGSDAERAPKIDCGVQSCLVAYQTILDGAGGASVIRGLRLLGTGDLLDPNPIQLVQSATTTQEPDVLATGGRFFLAWEDARNVGMGALGADLYARTVHEINTITADPGSLLVSADLRQSAVELVPAAGGNVMALWQDQRALTGTVSDDNIWRNLYTPMLAETGTGPAPVNTVPRSQSFPAADGDDNGALVVWGDRRSGGFTLVYGAVIDAAGTPKQPEGFPLLRFASAVSDQSVAKGPDADYLVLATRLQPAPARVFYRIVRDELPDGAMTPSGNLQVPADGVTVAQVTFDAAQGMSGFDVIDGTIYTLTLSRAVDVTVPDQDAATAGHQVTAVNGAVSFGLHTFTPGIVQVDLQSIEGNSTGTAMVTFENVPPEATNVRIVPPAPTSGEDLVLQYDYADVNSDPEGTSQIQWTKNSAAQANLNDLTTVAARFISRGDVWRARLRPHDGSHFGSFVFSNEVLVLNTPPQAVDVQIQPDTDVKTGTALTARYRFDDPDNDAEMGSVLTWYESGGMQAGLQNAPSVPAAMVVKGQSWSFGIVPHDGTSAGPEVRSATVAVENSVPVADAGVMAEVLERRVHDMDGSASDDVDPQDRLTFSWTQLPGGPRVNLSSTTSATVSFTAPSVLGTTMLTFALTVSDGEATSPEARVVVLVTPVADMDADGLDDEEEADLGTDPNRGDTDRDSLRDGEDVALGLDPLDADTDDDGIRDGEEPMPGEDADMDGLINAADHDSDNDGVFDGTEVGLTEPNADTDESAGHYLADADRMSTTDPLVADTDMDGLSDGDEDSNKNGRVERGESDPNDPTSTVGCAADGSCPGSLQCLREACREPPMADAGIMCRPLSEMGVQCCTGGCADGTPVAALCMMAGAREQCPVGAAQCILSACAGSTMPKPGDDSCSCTAAAGDRQSLGWSGLLGFALLLLRRKRG